MRGLHTVRRSPQKTVERRQRIRLLLAARVPKAHIARVEGITVRAVQYHEAELRAAYQVMMANHR
jgi:hypothetical protein